MRVAFKLGGHLNLRVVMVQVAHKLIRVDSIIGKSIRSERYGQIVELLLEKTSDKVVHFRANGFCLMTLSVLGQNQV